MDRRRARVPSLAQRAGGRAARLGGDAGGYESRRPAHGRGAHASAELVRQARRGLAGARPRIHRAEHRPRSEGASPRTPHPCKHLRTGNGRHPRPVVLTAAKEQALKPGDSFEECAQDCPEMIVIPAGSFTMGSPQTEAGHDETEEPQHLVTIGKSFAVAKYEVTYADWDACAKSGGCNGYKPNDYGLADANKVPVLNVNWDDAKAYVAWLTLVTGKSYRLLSEAEYEYAARAGTTTAYPWGDDIGKNNADCNGCGSQWDNERPAPVGSFPPNKFGLYDMVGNVFEWVEDCWHANYTNAPKDGSPWLTESGGNCDTRVVRGGSWD